MPDFVVVTAFKSKDQVSKDLKRMGLSVKNFGRMSDKSFGKASRAARGFKSVLGGVLGALSIQRGVALLQRGIGEVTTSFLDFDDAITAASAKFGIFDRESATFKALGRTARQVGATTEFTSAQAAEGLRFLAKAGWEANTAMKALPSFVNLATASELEFARAADIATDVMGAFQLKSDDTAENLKQLTRVNDVLSTAVNMSNIDMEDMFETIKMAGPIATTAGVSLEKFGAMAAFVGGAGIKGSLGGTALRTMFLSMAAPKKKAISLFKKLNIQLRDASGNLNDPIEIMKKLQKGLGKMGTAQKAAALNTLFGKRAVSGAAVSMEGAVGKLQEFEESLDKSSGASKRMAEFMRTSLSKRFAELKSAAIEAGFRIIDAFEKKIPGGIDAAIKAVRKFDVKNIVEGLRDIGKAMVFIGDGLAFLREYKGLIVGLGVAFAGMKFTPFLAFLGASNPLILAIVAATAGWASAIYTVVDNWKFLKVTFFETLDSLKAKFSETVKGIGDNFKELWLGIKSGLANMVVWAAEKLAVLGGAFGFDTSALSAGAAAIKAGVQFGGAKGPADSGLYKGQTLSSGGLGVHAPLSSPESNIGVQDRAKSQAGFLHRPVGFQGEINLKGAPKGTTFEGKTTGAPPIKTAALGPNL